MSTVEERNAWFGNPAPVGICSAETCDTPAYSKLGSQPMCAAHIDGFRQRIARDRARRERQRHEQNLADIFDWLGLS